MNSLINKVFNGIESYQIHAERCIAQDIFQLTLSFEWKKARGQQ